MYEVLEHLFDRRRRDRECRSREYMFGEMGLTLTPIAVLLLTAAPSPKASSTLIRQRISLEIISVV